MKIFTQKNSGGYAVLELLFYVSFFAAMSLAVVGAMVAMSGSFRETAMYAKLGQSGEIMERMSREVRTAQSIASISLISLRINTPAGGTREFRLSGGNIELYENNALVGNLNSSEISVSALSFTEITTVAGKAVKISMTLGLDSDKLGRQYDLNNTVALRGSY